MPLNERLRLARATYHAAVTQARLANTPHTWRRLARAGTNLREAEGRRRVQARPPRRAGCLLIENDPGAQAALWDLLTERLRMRTAPDDRAATGRLHRVRRLHQVKTPP